MADEYLHGVRVTEISEGTRTVRTVSTAIIGIVCTADDAEDETFPLNKAILTTNPQSLMSKAGKGGTLYRTLEAISTIVRTPCVIVRVPEDEENLTANIIGTIGEDGVGTGMKAFLSAQATLGVKPRIFAIPQLDTLDVATQLVAVAKKLHGMAYIKCNANNKEEAVQYRRNFGDREAMLIYGDFTNFNTQKNTSDTAYATAYAVGLRAYADKELGWHTTISNLLINGVSGVTKAISFDIQDSSTDANFLNSKEVCCVINYNGFRIWGSRTCSTDSLFAFEQATRTAQIIRDTIGEAYDWAIDKPLTPTLVKDMLEMINAKMRFWKSQGYIVDGKAWVDWDENTKETLKDGKFYIKYNYCPVPSLENLNLKQYITDEYLANFASAVATA
ncbi:MULTISPECIES: phage tail sheath protein [Pasteurellaceae]|uniref:Phage tail sheath protein n=1 Tax=Pasteurella atlantica TaxID=2827233 RepID=A0AAW8CNW5_9PAST|nr:phage tail sheath protein [Pasteurella atlantica]MBR0573359.1 phage tail sheath protein [Pasteurella atlantica]MDP8039833.1 phage tail sheath protein [Pasteurella atlantica]MDP8041850.1 phage tail sheath protein [Pasteurella atlantica]MDP8043917.1 phage tail sheath protein [Pasteurella atlantica]MDP8046079.1 phage tail sheath protein [Pasteurella atlantica]